MQGWCLLPLSLCSICSKEDLDHNRSLRHDTGHAERQSSGDGESLPPRLRETLNDFREDTASRQIRGTPNPVLKSAEKYTLKELLFELLVCIAGL